MEPNFHCNRKLSRIKKTPWSNITTRKFGPPARTRWLLVKGEVLTWQATSSLAYEHRAFITEVTRVDIYYFKWLVDKMVAVPSHLLQHMIWSCELNSPFWSVHQSKSLKSSSITTQRSHSFLNWKKILANSETTESTNTKELKFSTH